MIPLDLATRLREAGLVWRPAPGDQFAITDRDLDDQVFVISHMTIEVRGSLIAFNGTTEWALDDLEKDEALWLPREDQLPIDPSTDVPDGYDAEQRSRPGGFIGDPDIMDTWATSSLTPQIVGRG